MGYFKEIQLPCGSGAPVSNEQRGGFCATKQREPVYTQPLMHPAPTSQSSIDGPEMECISELHLFPGTLVRRNEATHEDTVFDSSKP